MGDEAERRGYGKSASVQQAVKQNAVQQLMKTEFDDKLSAAAVPAAEVEAYYKAHIDEYVQPALQRASHVMRERARPRPSSCSSRPRAWTCASSASSRATRASTT